MTKNLLILGAGTACALVANTRVRSLDLSQWEVAVVDRAREHDEAHLLHHVSGEHRSLAGAAGDDGRPHAIARERGDGLVLVPFAGRFEDSARHVARAGYPRLSEFRGVAHGTFVMLGGYACALLMTRAQLYPRRAAGLLIPIKPREPGRATLALGGVGFAVPLWAALMRAEASRVHSCPQCGGEVSRVRRSVRDRIVGLLEDVRRFRCVNAGCGWEGIISTDWMPHSVRTQLAMTWFARVTWMVVGVAVALVGMSGLNMYRNVRSTKATVAVVAEAEPFLVPSGVSHDGVDLPPGDPRVIGNPSSLSLRRGCAWGVPGRSPYKGTVSQALSGARLPPEVVRKVEAMVARGVVSEQLEISRDAIRTVSGKRQFDTNIVAMGFGSTLCFGTRVNFEPGHVERADLYDATDADGTRFAVMVPYVCGNVSVLAERAERPEGGGGGGGTSVPEPATLLLVASGLAAMAVRAWMSRATTRGVEGDE